MAEVAGDAHGTVPVGRILTAVRSNFQHARPVVQVAVGTVGADRAPAVAACGWRCQPYAPNLSAAPECRNAVLGAARGFKNHIQFNVVEWILVRLTRRVRPLRRAMLLGIRSEEHTSELQSR